MSNKGKEVDNETQKLKEELFQISNQAIQLKDIAQTNEIILNRTLRYLTGRLINIKKEPTVEKIDELIEYLNRIE